VAVYTHVTSDHLDRHGDVAAYRGVKRRLLELLPAGGVLVRNDDDAVVSTYATDEERLTVPYTRDLPPPGGLGVQDGWIVARSLPHVARLTPDVAEPQTSPPQAAQEGTDDARLPLVDIPLPGDHSISNVLAAVAVGLLHGVAPEAIREAVRTFPGVEHRLELVATIAGVRYVNDSQGTQPDAVIAAVRSFPRPLVLIAGGRSKGLAVAELASEVAERVEAKYLVAFTQSGDSARRLARHRCEIPILAFTPVAAVRSQLAMSWGIETFKVSPVQHTDEMVRQVDQALLQIGRVRRGDLVVIIAGSPPGIPGSTNALRVHRIGDAINEVTPAYRRTT